MHVLHMQAAAWENAADMRVLCVLQGLCRGCSGPSHTPNGFRHIELAQAHTVPA